LWRFYGDKERIGGYRPWRRPDLFFKAVEPPAEYVRLNQNPKYQVPLYQAVYHSALVSTDRWEFSPLKLQGLETQRLLTMVLYGVPPIWAVDERFLKNHGRQFASLAAFFAEYHADVGPESLDDFEWLDSDGSVQRSQFGNGTSVTVNYSKEPRNGVGGECALVKKEDGHTNTFCPGKGAPRVPAESR